MYLASAKIMALYYFNSYDLLHHVEDSTKAVSPFNQWGPICWVVQGVCFLPWGPLSRRPTGYTAQLDQTCFQILPTESEEYDWSTDGSHIFWGCYFCKCPWFMLVCLAVTPKAQLSCQDNPFILLEPALNNLGSDIGPRSPSKFAFSLHTIAIPYRE